MASGDSSSTQMVIIGSIQGSKDELYTELWHACAGPLIQVPRAGEKVFYFPQGHIEQVEAYTSPDGNVEMPIYDLPSKILCDVVCVQLKVEDLTDEVYAEITLLPVTKQNEKNLGDINSSPPRQNHLYSFSKRLTPSDTNTHGGFSVPKRHADECLPPLDMSLQPPAQELFTKDLHGIEWRFRHTYRGQPKRHLLTSGWSTFVTFKKLVAGDKCIFLRGNNGQVRVGVHRTMKSQNNALTSVISAQSMKIGILASATHAISTGTRFHVYYRPRTSPSEFVIPVHRYMKSADVNYSVGTRVTMQVEGEDCAEQRFSGTVVGIEDVDRIMWPDSEWRCLKVKWDATSGRLVNPERVSPWNIEPMDSTDKQDSPRTRPSKRARPHDPPSPEFASLIGDGYFPTSPRGSSQSSVEYASHCLSEVLQSQEIGDAAVNDTGVLRLPLLQYLISPRSSSWGDGHLALGNKQHFPVRDSLFLHRSSAASCPSVNHENDVVSRDVSVQYVNALNLRSPEWMRTMELNAESEAPLAKPMPDSGKCMLFGVNLSNPPRELPSPQVATSLRPKSKSSVSGTIQGSLSSESLSEKNCNNCHLGTDRSCTKVLITCLVGGSVLKRRDFNDIYFETFHLRTLPPTKHVLKQGTALGKSVDLTQFEGYQELMYELDQMFEFKGSLIDGNSGWQIAYEDIEGDMMVLGDYPWQEFQSMAHKIFICKKEYIAQLNPNAPN